MHCPASGGPKSAELLFKILSDSADSLDEVGFFSYTRTKRLSDG